MSSDRCDYDLIDGGFSIKDPNDPNVFVHVTNEDLGEFFKFLWVNFPEKIANARPFRVLDCGHDVKEFYDGIGCVLCYDFYNQM